MIKRLACSQPTPHMLVHATSRRSPEAQVRPTRPPVSSPSVAAKRLVAEVMGLLYRPLRSTVPQDRTGRKEGEGEGVRVGWAAGSKKPGRACSWLVAHWGLARTAARWGSTVLLPCAGTTGSKGSTRSRGLPEAKRSSRFSRGTRTFVKRMAPLSTPLSPTCTDAEAEQTGRWAGRHAGSELVRHKNQCSVSAAA